MIPKNQESVQIKDFRPISLVTSLYKVIAKFVTKIKEGNTSHSRRYIRIIEGRQILDCCLIANDLVEEYRLKKMSEWVFKVDFGKAYDNADRGFLDFVFLKKGFEERGGNGLRDAYRVYLSRFLLMAGA